MPSSTALCRWCSRRRTKWRDTWCHLGGPLEAMQLLLRRHDPWWVCDNVEKVREETGHCPGRDLSSPYCKRHLEGTLKTEASYAPWQRISPRVTFLRSLTTSFCCNWMPGWMQQYLPGTGMAGFRRAAIQQTMRPDSSSELTKIPSVASLSMRLLSKPLRVSGSFWRRLKWGIWKATKTPIDSRWNQRKVEGPIVTVYFFFLGQSAVLRAVAVCLHGKPCSTLWEIPVCSNWMHFLDLPHFTIKPKRKSFNACAPILSIIKFILYFILNCEVSLFDALLTRRDKVYFTEGDMALSKGKWVNLFLFVECAQRKRNMKVLLRQHPCAYEGMLF